MSTSTGRHSYGTTLGIDAAGGSSYTLLAEIIELNGPGLKIPAKMRTNLNSPSAALEKIPGLIDQGQLTMKLNMTMANYAALLALVRVAALGMEITYPLAGAETGAATLAGAGQLAELGQAFPDDDTITCDATFEATGLWTFTAATS